MNNKKYYIELFGIEGNELYEKLNAKYNKLKRTYEALSELVVETKADLDHLDSISTALSLSEDEKDLQLIKDELSDYGYIKSHGKKKGKKQAKSKPLHFISSDGFHMYVGKNNYQNDELSFKFANGGDWWFHAKNMPGSHVIVLMVLWLFFSYLFYFMNCGITQGIMEEALQKAADIRITGADYDTGKISYAKLNQNLIIGNIISSNKNGDTMAQKEIKEKIRQHLFMAKAGSVNVSTTSLKTSVKVKMQSNVISFQFLSGFGIQLFEYEGSLAALGDFEMEQIRGWNTIEGAMD